MFKKIEIWILYLVVFLGIPITIGFGSIVRYEMLGGKILGGISKTALFLAEIPSNLKELFLIDFEVRDRFPLSSGFNGTANLNHSYLLLSRYSGDLMEGIVELVDLTNFKVLHTWNPDIDKFNKSVNKVNEFKYLKRDANNSRYLLRHPTLLKDGGLLFQDKSPLRKIDSCSNLIFQNTNDIYHHSIEKDIDGNIWVPSHIYPQSLSFQKVGRDIMGKGGYYDDGIVKLSPNGEVLYEKSVSQIFIENDLEYLLFSTGDKAFNQDPLHLNDIQPVEIDGEFWQKGDVFLSLRNQSMILLFRPSNNKIIWKGTGPFFKQHDIDILNEHKISVFNNNLKNFIDGNVVDGHNEVIIYDFKEDKYSNYLKNIFVKNDIKTLNQGLSEILSNGDIFIEEQNFGRILYFDANGSLRWTYVNRAKNSKVYQLAWSRILHRKKDIQIVKKFLRFRDKCN